MARYGLFRRIWLTRLSRPAVERTIYRQVLRSAPRRIIELGLGTLGRTERLLGLLRSLHPTGELHYVGLDRFEATSLSAVAGVAIVGVIVAAIWLPARPRMEDVTEQMAEAASGNEFA